MAGQGGGVLRILGQSHTAASIMSAAARFHPSPLVSPARPKSMCGARLDLACCKGPWIRPVPAAGSAARYRASLPLPCRALPCPAVPCPGGRRHLSPSLSMQGDLRARLPQKKLGRMHAAAASTLLGPLLISLRGFAPPLLHPHPSSYRYEHIQAQSAPHPSIHHLSPVPTRGSPHMHR